MRSGFAGRRRHTSGAITAIATIVAALFLLSGLPAAAQDASVLPQISRNISDGEFVSAVGRRAALLGTADGGFEAWVYPLKIFRDLHVRFHVEGQTVPAATVARSVITRPESSTIVYSDASFQVRETLFIPIHEPGAVISFDVVTDRPLEVEVVFTPDFQLEWPAELGTSRVAWDSAKNALVLSAQQYAYAALVGSPTAHDFQARNRDTASAPDESSFLLGATERGSESKVVCIAASLKGPDDAAETYDRLVHGANEYMSEDANYYGQYLQRTLNVDLPDRELQQAYDWARVNLVQAMVVNPLVGTGLIAGYGTSGATERPGYDWFFGRDALWSSLALDAEGDFADTRTALEFLAKYQRSDGKIPHEIPQSATLVPWFEDYPYSYAAADATPLFLIAVNDYVQRSGDVSFARDKWDSIARAYQFLNSTLDASGFAKNAGVGTGWVEGGPLIPVRTEIYQAGVGIEALRAMAGLDRLLGKEEDAIGLEQKFQREKSLVNDLFWSPEKNIFAFAIDTANRRVDEATVLPAVPMWFGLLDPLKAKEMIAHLAAPDMQADWGMRILSSSSAKYASEGYHFGSVWPLFTGWAAVAEYRYHRSLDAYQNLRANALLALDGSPGHVTEVLAGNYYEPLSTSTPQQTWSAAMIVAPLIEGLLGLQTNATADEISLAPHVPADWTSFSINDLHVGSTSLSLRFQRDADGISLETTRTGGGKCTLDFSPAISLRASLAGTRLNGRSVPYRIEANDADQHVSVHFEVPPGKSKLRMRINDEFELSVTAQLPPMGTRSRGLRILSSSWTPARNRLNIDVAGVPGGVYKFSLWNASEIISVEGGELDEVTGRGPELLVRFPSGAGDYVQRRVILRFATKHPSKPTIRK
jgi:glycogen debranching enzyme